MKIPRTVIVGRGRVLPTDFKKFWRVLLNNIHKVCKMVGRLKIGYGGSFHLVELDECHKLGFPPALEGQLLNTQCASFLMFVLLKN